MAIGFSHVEGVEKIYDYLLSATETPVDSHSNEGRAVAETSTTTMYIKVVI